MDSTSANPFKAIYAKAFERFLLDLAREYAREEDRIALESRGRLYNPEIKEIELSGEYPDTGFLIRKYDRVRDLEQESWHLLWGHPEFFDSALKPLVSADRMVSDTLMWARGG